MVTRWRGILRSDDPVDANKDRISSNSREQISWGKRMLPLKNGNVLNVRILSQATNINGEWYQFPKNPCRFSFYGYYEAGELFGLQTDFPRPEAERPGIKGIVVWELESTLVPGWYLVSSTIPTHIGRYDSRKIRSCVPYQVVG